MSKTSVSSEGLACMAEIVGVHGIKGAVKLKIFTDQPENLSGYASFCDADRARTFEFTSLSRHGNTWLATIKGLADRTAAEKLRGTKLYVPREELPAIEEDDTYYHADLIGLSAQWPDGKPMGKVINVVNFGAGDLLDIKPAKGPSFYVPFTNAVVPQIDIAGGTMTVDPPHGLIDGKE